MRFYERSAVTPAWCPDQTPMSSPPRSETTSLLVVGLNPPLRQNPLERNRYRKKTTLGRNPPFPRNQMQPLVCNAVVLKVRKIYVHQPLVSHSRGVSS